MFEFTSSNQEPGNVTGGILEVVGGFDVTSGSKWIFPDSMPRTLGTDGCVGKTTVSQYQRIVVANAHRALALHVTFNIKEAFIASIPVRDPKILLVRISLTNLHYTARPENVQLTISDDGYSLIAAGASVHRGAFSSWNHNDDASKLQSLAQGLGMNENVGGGWADAKRDINAALAAYDAASVVALGQRLIDALGSRIVNRIQRTKTYQNSSEGYTAKAVIVTQNFATKEPETHTRTN